jgi:SAM-dependent methyltransferase
MICDDAISFYRQFSPDYEGIRGDESLLDQVELKGKTVLDIGCGGGFDAKKASETASDVIAIDVQESMILYAIKNNPAKNIYYMHGDASKERFQESFFDVVYMNWSAFHFKNKLNLFKKVRSIIKPGGSFLLSDTWLYHPEAFGEGWYFEPPTEYVILLNEIFGNVEYLGEKKQSDVFYRINFKCVK